MKTGAGGGQALLFTVLGAACLGLSPIFVRLSEMGPNATSVWRFVFALPLFALIPDQIRAPPPIRLSLALILAGALFGADVVLWSAALGFTTVVNATLLSNMTPIFAAAGAWALLRERVGAGAVLGAAIALSGAWLLAEGRAQPAVHGHGPAWIGDALGLFAAFWYAGYLLIVRRIGMRVGLSWVMGLATFGALLLALVGAFFTGEALWPPSTQSWLALIGLGLIVQALGQGLIAFGVARLPIAISTVLLWTQPVAAAVLSWALFGERLGWLALLGASLVLGGVLVVQKSRKT